mmetsp:Transcript_58194/g.118491  ORF Transcript_58194/g.118491 Transcript_58194/m.118491 type:complete len:216 (+) Transcript_58194:608-1255(+)
MFRGKGAAPARRRLVAAQAVPGTGLTALAPVQSRGGLWLLWLIRIHDDLIQVLLLVVELVQWFRRFGVHRGTRERAAHVARLAGRQPIVKVSLRHLHSRHCPRCHAVKKGAGHHRHHRHSRGAGTHGRGGKAKSSVSHQGFHGVGEFLDPCAQGIELIMRLSIQLVLLLHAPQHVVLDEARRRLAVVHPAAQRRDELRRLDGAGAIHIDHLEELL